MNKSKRGKMGQAPLRSDPESRIATARMSRILEQVIQNLPEQCEAVVMMRDIEEMTTRRLPSAFL